MREYNRIVYLIGVIAALGGLLFGLDQGFIANSLQTISATYKLTEIQGSHYAAVLAWGGIIGALCSGFLARKLGRKTSLVLAGFIFSLMSITSAFLPPLPILTACRFFLGFAVGIASFLVPLYLSETAPTKIRGGMTSLFQLMITIGIFLIAVTNVYIARLLGHTEKSLSTMFLVIVVFAVIMFIGTLLIPESPRWLILKGRHQKAKSVLKEIRSSKTEVEKEIEDIRRSVAQNQGIGFSMLRKGFFWKVLFIGVALQMFQQLVGINLMIYYAPTFFGYAKMTGMVALLAVPVVNMLSTFPAVKLIEHWGRKRLLYTGAVIMLLTLLTAGFAFLSAAHHHGDPTMTERTVLLIAVVIYIIGFAVSWGPVAWVICAEIFPLKGREIGMTVTTMVNWTFAGVVMANALAFMKHFGDASIFFVFAAFCVLAIIFLKLFVPETKNISLEHIERNLEKGVKLKHIGAQNPYGN